MGFTTQDIREHYMRMDTESLMSMANNDLTDVARDVLDDELARRGVPFDTVRRVRAQAAEAQMNEAKFEARLAPIDTRLAAFAIDFLGVATLLYIVLLPVTLLSATLHESIMLTVFWTYFLFRDGRPGLSVGKALMSLKTVRIDTGEPAGVANSFWRNIAHFVFVVDAAMALGRHRMRFGDMVAKTVVMKQ